MVFTLVKETAAHVIVGSIVWAFRRFKSRRVGTFIGIPNCNFHFLFIFLTPSRWVVLRVSLTKSTNLSTYLLHHCDELTVALHPDEGCTWGKLLNDDTTKSSKYDCLSLSSYSSQSRSACNLLKSLGTGKFTSTQMKFELRCKICFCVLRTLFFSF